MSMHASSLPILLVLSLIAAVSVGCADTTDEEASFNLIVEDRTGADYTFEGSDPSCRINTSFPEGDPLRGVFYIGFLSTNEAGSTSLYVHFLDYTTPPPAGTYSNSDPQVEISFDTDFADDEVDVAANERDLSEVFVVLTDEGNGLRMELGDGFPGASGFVQCAP